MATFKRNSLDALLYQIVETVSPFDEKIPYEFIINEIGQGLASLGTDAVYDEVNLVLPVRDYVADIPADYVTIERIYKNDDNVGVITYNPYLDVPTTNRKTTVDSIANHSCEYNIKSSKLIFSFPTGNIRVVYKGLPVDENNRPTIPDLAEVRDGLMWYVIYKMSMGRYVFKNAELNSPTRNKKMSDMALAEARNRLHRPTREQLVRVSTRYKAAIPTPPDDLNNYIDAYVTQDKYYGEKYTR